MIVSEFPEKELCFKALFRAYNHRRVFFYPL
nr:MAG TPA: hypothetical protein [Caudoviricetes sp.]